ncbi:MAG TPA: glycosyltransferase family 2 protein [Patescibacteria group bacterium]|nr:glycosyltransferase family 2 protein [Patescibacteria group bacterium]
MLKLHYMLSIVVPVYNEEESLPHFFVELISQLKKIREPFEVIFVDDGSVDNSFNILKEFEANNKDVRLFSFRKNAGKAEALSLGFAKALGEIIITLDADLQDQPSEIPHFLAKHKEGYDVVCGWRKERKDASKMKIISKLFNYVLNKAFDLTIHDYNCGFKLYTRDAAKSLHLYGGLHRFIPILVYEQGFSVTEIPVRHEVRKYGESKYKFSKIKDLPDMFTMLFLMKYMQRPLHFFGAVGGLLSLIGTLILLYLTILHFLGESIGRRPLLIFGFVFVVTGLQIFFTGFLAELLINISQKGEHHNYPLKYLSPKNA